MAIRNGADPLTLERVAGVSLEEYRRPHAKASGVHHLFSSGRLPSAAIIAAVSAIALTVAGCGGAKQATTSSPTGVSGAGAVTTVVLTEGGLRSLAKTRGRPVYWFGPQFGADYAVTRTPNGRIFVRYVPASSKLQANKEYISIGTTRCRMPMQRRNGRPRRRNSQLSLAEPA